MNGNDLEFKRLEDSVVFKDYRCPDVTYQARLDRLNTMAGFWGLEHWKLRARKAEVLAAYFVAHRHGNDEQADNFLEAHAAIEARLLAFDAALVAVCDREGVSADDVRKLADAAPFISRRTVEPDAEAQAEMESALAQLLAE